MTESDTNPGDAILRSLPDEDLAGVSVSDSETAARSNSGDDEIDHEPRKPVSEETWQEILTQLQTPTVSEMDRSS